MGGFRLLDLDKARVGPIATSALPDPEGAVGFSLPVVTEGIEKIRRIWEILSPISL